MLKWRNLRASGAIFTDFGRVFCKFDAMQLPAETRCISVSVRANYKQLDCQEILSPASFQSTLTVRSTIIIISSSTNEPRLTMTSKMIDNYVARYMRVMQTMQITSAPNSGRGKSTARVEKAEA